MTFKAGNNENPHGARRPRMWQAALDRALARAEHENNYKSLNALADKLLERAAEGDIAALREFGDRIEGKAAQSIAGADGESPAELILRWAQSK